jgi:hypothetical protein
MVLYNFSDENDPEEDSRRGDPFESYSDMKFVFRCVVNPTIE